MESGLSKGSAMSDKALSDFAAEVHKGLSASPKALSSRFFYDDRGSRIFQDIMAMPEYYITRREETIIRTFKKAITDVFAEHGEFELIELGAGDGQKTKILLELWYKQGIGFHYYPIDISPEVLRSLEGDLKRNFSGIRVQGLPGTYLEVLDGLGRSNKRRIIMMLGSNIGNMSHEQAAEFLHAVKKGMTGQDLLFIGFDQKKNPQTILDAYNDRHGITAEFNLNLLRRINGELGGDFDISKFFHWPTYDPQKGTMLSFVVSQEEQKVRLEELGQEYHFRPYEAIHTEISQKYDHETITFIAEQAGFKVSRFYADPDNYFRDYILHPET